MSARSPGPSCSGAVFAHAGGRVVDEGWPSVPGSGGSPLVAICLLATLALEASRVLVEAVRSYRVHPVDAPPVSNCAEALSRRLRPRAGCSCRRPPVFAANLREARVGVRPLWRGVALKPARDPEREKDHDREDEHQAALSRGGVERRSPAHGSSASEARNPTRGISAPQGARSRPRQQHRRAGRGCPDWPDAAGARSSFGSSRAGWPSGSGRPAPPPPADGCSSGRWRRCSQLGGAVPSGERRGRTSRQGPRVR